jgi:hypothetical protein
MHQVMSLGSYINNMKTSKFKLLLIWALFITGTYIFWIFSYFVLVKFALGEINELQYAAGNIYQSLSLNSVFWYMLYIGGIGLCMLALKQLVLKAPSPKLAAIIYGLLIVISAGILINQLVRTVNIIHVLPHIIVNVCFLIAIVIPSVKFNADVEKFQKEL